MPELKSGDSFPEGVSFGYIPIDSENSDFSSCGIPQKFNASEGTAAFPLPPALILLCFL